MANGQDPLVNFQLQVQQLIDANTPETLRAAENLINAFAPGLPSGQAVPQAVALSRQLAKKRAKRVQFERAERELGTSRRGPRALAPTAQVELERITPAVEGQVPQLEEFAVPQGLIPPGGREVGRLITTEGEPLARAIIEGPPTAAPPTAAAPTGLRSFTAAEVARLNSLFPSAVVGQMISARERQIERLPTDDLRDMRAAGLDVGNRSAITDFTPGELKGLNRFRAEQRARAAARIQEEKDALKGAAAKRAFETEPLKKGEAQSVIRVDNLTFPIGITGKQRADGLNDGTLVAAPRPSDLSSAKQFRALVPRLMRLAELSQEILAVAPGRNVGQAIVIFGQRGAAASKKVAEFDALRRTLKIQATKVIQGARPSDFESTEIGASFPTEFDTVGTALTKVLAGIDLFNGIAAANLGVPALTPDVQKRLDELKALNEQQLLGLERGQPSPASQLQFVDPFGAPGQGRTR